MPILSRLRLHAKLALLMGLSVLAIVASISVASSVMRQRLIDDRVDKLRSIAQATAGVAQSLQDQVAARLITGEQAYRQFRDAVHAIRFDAGAGYVVAYRLDDGVMMANGSDAKLDGKPSAAKDASGTPLVDMMRQALRNSNDGFVSYMFARPGETVAQPKVAYLLRYPPWDLVLNAGAYTSDLDAAFHAALWKVAGLGGGILLATTLAAWLIDRDIAGSLRGLMAAMERLANGALDAEIPGIGRRDEIGGMAGAVLIFKEYMQRAKTLTAEREQEREQADANRQAALAGMAEMIEGEARQALGEIGRRTTTMTETAASMTSSAGRTGASAGSAATAAAHALANAQTVASAAEELAASIREIGHQVSQSSAVVSRAVAAGRETRETIGALNERVARIGTVADMISEIAARTNLLALNATIEAARAGDAGKGFAVVASEVKQLATQTARSTEEISRHIAEVRSATAASVDAVGRIEGTIGEINAISSSIAAAVEEQGTATGEIARNVSETAAAANEMTSRTQEVSSEAEHTGQQALEVRENIVALDTAMHDLHRTVLHIVRTATSEVDRRRYRRRACYVEATIEAQGRSEAALLRDVSERGCHAITEASIAPGQQVEIAAPRFAARVTGTVVEQSGDGVHIAFTGDGLTTAEADRISLASVDELMQKAKDDHCAFVARVVDILARGEKLPPDTLASPHHCRLGRWYDDICDSAAMALGSFKAIRQPHEAVHELGRRVLIALGVGDSAGAEGYAAEMRRQSDEVMRRLDAFGQEYPTTFAKAAA